jgi:hypothetical protein
MSDTATERRNHRRRAIELQGTIARVAGPPLSGAGVTVDLSDGGARLVGPAAFVVGDVVRISIAEGETMIEHQGLVVGRQSTSTGLATLNVAFRTTPSNDTIDLRGLVSPLD